MFIAPGLEILGTTDVDTNSRRFFTSLILYWGLNMDNETFFEVMCVLLVGTVISFTAIIFILMSCGSGIMGMN